GAASGQGGVQRGAQRGLLALAADDRRGVAEGRGIGRRVRHGRLRATGACAAEYTPRVARPVHDEASHAADAFGTFAQALAKITRPTGGYTDAASTARAPWLERRRY